MRKQIAVLTGAGVSAESGLRTFRETGGLWEDHDVMDVASPEGWHRNRALVLDFYNQRRRQLKEVQPNRAHLALVELENEYDVHIITQNVDDLHERAGSSRVLHLHGELLKVRSTGQPNCVLDWSRDLNIGDLCPEGHQLRPHIVWFGEPVPLIEAAAGIVHESHFIIIIGTSMQVYPAAGLVGFALPGAQIHYVDPNPSVNFELQSRINLEVHARPATEGVPEVVSQLMKSH